MLVWPEPWKNCVKTAAEILGKTQKNGVALLYTAQKNALAPMGKGVLHTPF